METVEWWPDYGRPPLWLSRGRHAAAVAPRALGLDEDLDRRLMAWAGAYSEDKLPIDGAGDSRWLSEGRSLLRETRVALAGRFDLVVTEPWWREPPLEG